MWAEVITDICSKLEAEQIRYHADASSALFVHGFDFDMEDFDLTVEWSKIEQAHKLFMEYAPTEISGDSPKQFKFDYRGRAIDVMAYQSETGIGPDDERVCIPYSGTRIWSKHPDFYLDRMRPEHPLKDAAFQFFGRRS